MMMMMYNVEGQKTTEIFFKHRIPQSLLRAKLKCLNCDSSFIGASQEFLGAYFRNDPFRCNAMLILNKKIFLYSRAREL
jgi:hypothetical protein